MLQQAFPLLPEQQPLIYSLVHPQYQPTNKKEISSITKQYKIMPVDYHHLMTTGFHNVDPFYLRMVYTNAQKKLDPKHMHYLTTGMLLSLISRDPSLQDPVLQFIKQRTLNLPSRMVLHDFYYQHHIPIAFPQAIVDYPQTSTSFRTLSFYLLSLHNDHRHLARVLSKKDSIDPQDMLVEGYLNAWNPKALYHRSLTMLYSKLDLITKALVHLLLNEELEPITNRHLHSIAGYYCRHGHLNELERFLGDKMQEHQLIMDTRLMREMYTGLSNYAKLRSQVTYLSRLDLPGISVSMVWNAMAQHHCHLALSHAEHTTMATQVLSRLMSEGHLLEPETAMGFQKLFAQSGKSEEAYALQQISET
ncbi:hypothetical protein EDD86DRAFT_196546 [Gorgonomyces haynaldii]|nr:hypothetical protein EDD86DRAFT_196546 [Gorgonomyces haynaldii]